MLKSGRVGIYFFISSLAFLLYVSRKKRIEALSLYWIFIAFQCLYNFTPWVVSISGYKVPFMELISDRDTVNLQILLAASANFCFGLVYLAGYKDVRLGHYWKDSSSQERRNFVLLATPFFMLTSLLCFKYGWNQIIIQNIPSTSAGGMFKVAVDAKFICIGIYLYYLYRFGLDKWGWVLFAEHVAILIVDGARTTFLPLALLTFFLYNARSGLKNKRRIYALITLGILLSIIVRGVVAAGAGATIFQKILLPVAVEGTMGTYPSLQSIYAITHNVNTGYTYGASYVLDPITWFLPHGELRDQLQFFEPWTKEIYPGIPSEFAPMGGFYYVSEAIAAFSYAGPAIVTSLFALCMIWIERKKNEHPMLFMMWFSTIGVLFVKNIFAGNFKMFIIQVLIFCTLTATRRFKGVLFSRPSYGAVVSRES